MTTDAPRFAISDVEHPDIDALRPYHKNPRVGDVDAVAESLAENGMFKPIVVNRGEKTGRENEILAGNHTWLAARSLGWDVIAAVYVDVDDEGAARIVLADNRTSDNSVYDEDILVGLLEDLPSLEGTGYTDVDLSEMLASLPDPMELVGTTKHTVLPEDPEELKKVQGASDVEDLDEDEEHEDVRPGTAKVVEPPPERVEASSIDAHPDQFAGMVQVADPNVRFELDETPFDIPKLLIERIPELPGSMDCWAGPLVCQDEPGKQWFYNYSSDSTKGMPWDRTTLGFYVFDERFENWWKNPDKMVTKTMNAGCYTAVMPDYSVIDTNPRAEQLYAVYRNQWLGRFMQECGMDVIPNLTVPTKSADLEWALAGIPDNPPSLSMQLQTVAAGKGLEGKGTDAGQLKRTKRLILEAIDIVNPDAILVYCSAAGIDVLKHELKLKQRVVVVPTRWYRKELSGLAETRGKRAPLKTHDTDKETEQRMVKKRKKKTKDKWQQR